MVRLTGCHITDLSPLQGMDLRQCYLTPRHILRGAEVLGTMSKVTIVASEGQDSVNYSAGEFLKKYELDESKTPRP